MDGKENSRRVFENQMRRIQEVAEKRTQTELADFLGIRQSSVSDAKRRGRIPAGWLVTILRIKGVHPEWILTGLGPCYTRNTPPKSPEAEDILRSLPFKTLADELVRRIELAQAEGFIGKGF